MAPPCYADIGKACKDLLSKGFHPGSVKFEAKTQTANGLKFTTDGEMQMDSGKTVGGAELNVAWPDYGLKYVEKWNTDNQLTVDMSIEDKLIQGLKTSFISSYNPTSSKKRGTVKASYKNDYVNVNTDADLDYAGPCFRAAAVVGYQKFLAGYQMGFDSSKNKFSANNFSLSFDDGKSNASVTVNNGQDVSGSVHHKCSSNWEGGISASYTSSGGMVGHVAAKHMPSPDTNTKMKVSTDGQIGLSVQQKVCSSVSLTLSAMLDAKNFSAGGHRVGMAIEFEQ